MFDPPSSPLLAANAVNRWDGVKASSLTTVEYKQMNASSLNGQYFILRCYKIPVQPHFWIFEAADRIVINQVKMCSAITDSILNFALEQMQYEVYMMETN